MFVEKGETKKIIAERMSMIVLNSFFLRASRGDLHCCVVHEEGDNEAEQAKRLGKDEHQNHGDEDLLLLGVGADGRVADDADGEAGGERRETGGEAGTEVEVAGEGRVAVVVGVDVVVDDDGDDEAVDTEDTSHDDGDDASHDAVGGVDAEVGEADAGLGRAVGRAEVGEDEGGRAAHGAEEGGGLRVLVGASGLALGDGEAGSSGEERDDRSLGNVHVFFCLVLKLMCFQKILLKRYSLIVMYVYLFILEVRTLVVAIEFEQ